MLDPLPAVESREDVRFFLESVRREQLDDGMANHLLRRVPEGPLRSLVPALDDTVEVFADDGVLRGIDDRRIEELGRNKRSLFFHGLRFYSGQAEPAAVLPAYVLFGPGSASGRPSAVPDYETFKKCSLRAA